MQKQYCVYRSSKPKLDLSTQEILAVLVIIVCIPGRLREAHSVWVDTGMIAVSAELTALMIVRVSFPE